MLKNLVKDEWYNDHTLPIFIDRDPDIFTYVLQWLRSHQLPLSSTMDHALLRSEADFFGLQAMVDQIDGQRIDYWRLSLCVRDHLVARNYKEPIMGFVTAFTMQAGDAVDTMSYVGVDFKVPRGFPPLKYPPMYGDLVTPYIRVNADQFPIDHRFTFVGCLLNWFMCHGFIEDPDRPMRTIGHETVFHFLLPKTV